MSIFHVLDSQQQTPARAAAQCKTPSPASPNRRDHPSSGGEGILCDVGDLAIAFLKRNARVADVRLPDMLRQEHGLLIGADVLASEPTVEGRIGVFSRGRELFKPHEGPLATGISAALLFSRSPSPGRIALAGQPACDPTFC